MLRTSGSPSFPSHVFYGSPLTCKHTVRASLSVLIVIVPQICKIIPSTYCIQIFVELANEGEKVCLLLPKV